MEEGHRNEPGWMHDRVLCLSRQYAALQRMLDQQRQLEVCTMERSALRVDFGRQSGWLHCDANDL